MQSPRPSVAMNNRFVKFRVPPPVFNCVYILAVLLALPMGNTLGHGQDRPPGHESAGVLVAASEFRERITDAPPLVFTDTMDDAGNATKDADRIPEVTAKEQDDTPAGSASESESEDASDPEPKEVAAEVSGDGLGEPLVTDPALAAPEQILTKPLPGNAEEKAQEQQFREARFLVQIGAFKVRDHAEHVLAELKQDHASAGLVQVAFEGEQWFIVYADNFDRVGPAMERAEIFRILKGRPAVVVEVSNSSYRLVLE